MHIFGVISFFKPQTNKRQLNVKNESQNINLLLVDLFCYFGLCLEDYWHNISIPTQCLEFGEFTEWIFLLDVCVCHRHLLNVCLCHRHLLNVCLCHQHLLTVCLCHQHLLTVCLCHRHLLNVCLCHQQLLNVCLCH